MAGFRSIQPSRVGVKQLVRVSRYFPVLDNVLDGLMFFVTVTQKARGFVPFME